MIDIDLFFLNFFFTVNVAIWIVSLYLGLAGKVYIKPAGRLNPEQRVSILVPLLREKTESIMTTAKSIASQTYPRELFETVFIVEPDDALTVKNIQPVLEYLKNEGVRHRIVKSDGEVKMKPHALNCALKKVNSDVVAIYDADDIFPKKQVEEAVTLIEEGYDAISVPVYRYRNTVLASFLHLDTFIWYNIFIPFFQAVGKTIPFSGEGLFLRKKALDAVGGIPEVLTEDAYLSILMAEKQFKTGLLDSEVEELAPKGLMSTIKQRLRWNRGYLQCMARVVKARIPLKKKLPLLVAYWAPITCAASLIASTFFMLYWITWAFAPGISIVAPWMRTAIYTNILYYWSATLAYLVTTSLIYLIAYMIAGERFERLAPYVIVLPIYWLFLGLISLIAPLTSGKYWFKTERR